MVETIGCPGQWPLFGDRTGLVERAVALEVRTVTTHEGRHRFGPRQRHTARQPPETPPEPRSDPGLAGGEPIEYQTHALVLVELQDMLHSFLRNDSIRVYEAEHPPGAGRGADIARRGAGPADATDESYADLVGEGAHDGARGVLALVVYDDDLE